MWQDLLTYRYSCIALFTIIAFDLIKWLWIMNLTAAAWRKKQFFKCWSSLNSNKRRRIKGWIQRYLSAFRGFYQWHLPFMFIVHITFSSQFGQTRWTSRSARAWRTLENGSFKLLENLMIYWCGTSLVIYTAVISNWLLEHLSRVPGTFDKCART